MLRARTGALSLGVAVLASALASAAQTGAIEFTAHVTPAGGVSEPVRGLPFYLLRKSFADIHKEADLTEPHPDLNTFVDSLKVSKELRAWMKKNKTVKLSGEVFTKSLKTDDVMNVPEFFDAYVEFNSANRGVGFPIPKYHERDKDKDPAKYAKLKQEYRDAIRKYLDSNPLSTDQMDMLMVELDPSYKWEQLETERLPAIRRLTLQLAETKYLVARGTSDLEGHGSFRDIPPGEYWISTLEIDATIGEIHLRWDAPVAVRAGETTQFDISNVNSVEPHRSK